jgi:hypothetical protein
MRTPLRPCYAIALAMAWYLLPGCKKVAERLEQDPDEIGKFCKIDTFNFGPPSAYQQQMELSYNADGDPVTEWPLTSYLFGSAFDNVFFHYDKYRRPVDIFYVFPDYDPSFGFSTGDIDLWHRFTYPSPGIVIDSLFNYDGPGIPPVANPPTGYTSLIVSRYQQDEKGRTIRTDIKSVNSLGSSTFSYYTEYDRKGNKVAPGAVYDDKINIYRTNKVWQLLFQDYSLNNRIYAVTGGNPYPPSIVSYDKWGLPLLLATNPAQQELPFFNGLFPYYTYMSVSYSCDDAASKQQPFSAP